MSRSSCSSPTTAGMPTSGVLVSPMARCERSRGSPTLASSSPFRSGRRGRLDQLPVEPEFGTGDVTLWLTRSDGSDAATLGSPARGPAGPLMAAGCTSRTGDGGIPDQKSARRGWPAGAGSHRQRDRMQPAPADALYYAKILTQATGAWDFEIRVAKPEDGPSGSSGVCPGRACRQARSTFMRFRRPTAPGWQCRSSMVRPPISGRCRQTGGMAKADRLR